MSSSTFLTLFERATSERMRNPFCFTEYEKLMEHARENSLLDEPQVWELRFHRESLNPDDIRKWEAAIDRVNMEKPTHCVKPIDKSSFYFMVSDKFPIPENILNYLEHSNKDNLAISSLQDYYDKCKYDFVDGQLVFDWMISFLQSKHESEVIRELYEERLKIPHRQIQDTYDAFSSFISSHFAQDYTRVMRSASKSFRATERSQRYYEILEQAVTSDPDNPEPWSNYIKQVYLYSDNNLEQPAFLSVFYRSLFSGSRCKLRDPSWLDIWIESIRFLGSSGMPRSKQNTFALYLIKDYCTEVRAYSEVVWLLSSALEVDLLKTLAINMGLFKTPSRDLEMLAKNLITVQYAVSQHSKVFDSVLHNVNHMCEAFPNDDNMISFCLRMLEKALVPNKETPDHSPGSHEEKYSKSIVAKYRQQNEHSAKAWITTFDFCDRVNYTSVILSMLQKLESELPHFDDPRSVYLKADTYLRTSVTLSTLSRVRQKIQSLARAYCEYEQNQQMEVEKVEEELPSPESSSSARKTNTRPREEDQPDSSELPNSKKVKSEPAHEVSEPTRSREQFRVKLYPLAKGITEEAIKKFLTGYADPLSITITDESDDIEKNFAVVELSSEQEVLSCLTRQFKPLLDLSVNIQRIFGTTVWATNYPSSYSSQDIQNMIIELTGKHPIALRLPYQRDNKERRFFYADFSDEEAASLVRDKLSGHVLEGHELQAEISNPTLRKPKDIAPPERQIHLHNLNFKQTTEESLRQYFSKWGEVASIHLPLSEASKSKGFINNGFAFVTFATEASATSALAEGKATIDERQIDISAVKPKKYTDKKSPGFDDQKTITINNISETVTEGQLQKFIEEKVGPVTQLSLKPSKKMALVEFEDVKTAGKAGFALEGVEYEDHILHVGPKKDFFHEEKTVKVPSMVSPMLMRRKRRKN